MATPALTAVPVVVASLGQNPIPGVVAMFGGSDEAGEVYADAGIPVLYVLPEYGQPGVWGLRTLGQTPPGYAKPVLRRGGEYSHDYGATWTRDVVPDQTRENAFGLGLLVAGVAMVLFGGTVSKWLK